VQTAFPQREKGISQAVVLVFTLGEGRCSLLWRAIFPKGISQAVVLVFTLGEGRCSLLWRAIFPKGISQAVVLVFTLGSPLRTGRTYLKRPPVS